MALTYRRKSHDADTDNIFDLSGNVIPLQFFSINNIKLGQLFTDKHLKFALINLQKDKDRYIVYYRNVFVSNFSFSKANSIIKEQNPVAAILLMVFPYKIGGIKNKRPRLMRFDEYSIFIGYYNTMTDRKS